MIFRAMTMIALALAFSIQADAQLGGAINRARNAVNSATGNTGNTATDNVINNTVASAKLTPEQRDAIAKLTDESKRKAKKSAMLSSDGPRLSDWFTGQMGGKSFPDRTPEELQALKAEIEPRHAENVEIYCTLWEIEGDCKKFVESHDFDRVVQPSIKPEVREALNSPFAGDELEKELGRYNAIMGYAKQYVRPYAKIKIDGDFSTGSATTTVESLTAGVYFVRYFDNVPYFAIMDERGNPVITPASEQAYNQVRNGFTNAQWVLRIDGSAYQYEDYWVADVAKSTMAIAQRNSKAKETKLPVPTPKMNDAALTAKMLKLAQEAYPTWGIVRLIIDESAWRPETNALGVIIHRRINTKIILPRSGGGYIMRTLSFIEPYAGGSYGEARPFGIGTDEVAVDYK